MQGFYDLLKESVIMQGVLAVMFGATVSYMYATGQEVPDGLLTLLGAIIGFYFGGKGVVLAQKRLP